ncbi:unnamed protein product [Schistosoma mattheei]|uniref:Exoribonuclease phosphorolytic domain-containing protein n=1 Tax=Schistosoma mattheei TaxID=31246 RepID=A0A183Q6R8_9TREM|nr:unnamed protein product [Schistosoma mattheei]
MVDSTSLFIETNTDCNAVGSATWDFAGHHVVFSIYGPDEAKIHDELTHRAYVDVTVTPRTGQRTSKESELEVYLNNLLERLIDVKEFPRSKVSAMSVTVSELKISRLIEILYCIVRNSRSLQYCFAKIILMIIMRSCHHIYDLYNVGEIRLVSFIHLKRHL